MKKREQNGIKRGSAPRGAVYAWGPPLPLFEKLTKYVLPNIKIDMLSYPYQYHSQDD